MNSLDTTMFEWLGWFCGTKRRLKCPWMKRKKNGGKRKKKAHHSIQCKCLPCSQSTGVSFWSLLSSVDSFSAVYGSNWYVCRPYCLLAFSGSILSSSMSLLSQNKCRRSSLLTMFQLIHKWRNKSGNPKSNRILHFSWLEVNISIFYSRFWGNHGEFITRIWNSVLLEVALEFYLIINIKNKVTRASLSGWNSNSKSIFILFYKDW